MRNKRKSVPFLKLAKKIIKYSGSGQDFSYYWNCKSPQDQRIHGMDHTGFSFVHIWSHHCCYSSIHTLSIIIYYRTPHARLGPLVWTCKNTIWNCRKDWKLGKEISESETIKHRNVKIFILNQKIKNIYNMWLYFNKKTFKLHFLFRFFQMMKYFDPDLTLYTCLLHYKIQLQHSGYLFLYLSNILYCTNFHNLLLWQAVPQDYSRLIFCYTCSKLKTNHTIRHQMRKKCCADDMWKIMLPKWNS